MNYFNAPKILWRKLLQQLLESSCSGQLSNYGWKGSAKILNWGHNQYWNKETRTWRQKPAKFSRWRFLLLLVKFVFIDNLHDDHCFFHCNANALYWICIGSFRQNLWLIGKSGRAISFWSLQRMGCFVTLVDRFDSLANVRRWGFLQPWETVACPTQTSQTIWALATSSFQRSAASAKAQTLLLLKKPLAGPIAQLLSLPLARALACAQAFQIEEGDWNSVCIDLLARMVSRSSSSDSSRSKEVVVLLISFVVAEGSPAFHRDLLTNQVCQFQVSK